MERLKTKVTQWNWKIRFNGHRRELAEEETEKEWLETGKEIAIPPSGRKTGIGFPVKYPEREKWKPQYGKTKWKRPEMEMKRGKPFPW